MVSSSGWKVALPLTGISVNSDHVNQLRTILDLRAAVGGDSNGVTHLGIVCIWWNYVIRYKNQLIYTYSGLFCIASHPYKRIPIYALQAKELYMVRGVISAGSIFLLLLREPTRTWCRQVTTSPSSSLESLELTGLKTPRRLFPTVLPSAPQARGRKDKLLLSSTLSRPTRWWKPGEMLRLWEIIVFTLWENLVWPTNSPWGAAIMHSWHLYNEVPDLKEKFLLGDDIRIHWFVFQGNLAVPFINYRGVPDFCFISRVTCMS